MWRLVIDEESGEVVVADVEPDLALSRALHRTIHGVHADMEAMRFNTAIAKLIELTNLVTKAGTHPRTVIEPLVLMLAPFAPHLAEEMWSLLGHEGTLAFESFPQADPALLVEDSVTCVVQVQGKVRAKLEVSPSATDDQLSELALAEPNVQRAIDGREVRRVVVRAPKLVNVVV